MVCRTRQQTDLSTPRWKGIPVRANTSWTIGNWVNRSNGFKHDATTKSRLYIDVERSLQKALANLRGVRSPHTHCAQVGVTDGGVAGRQHRKPDIFDKEFLNEHGVQIIAVFIILRILFVRVETKVAKALL